MANHEDSQFEDNIDILPKHREKLKRPPMFKVLLHNDNYTTMEFVVQILITVFHKSVENATKLMLEVHQKGKSMVGVYTREIAETKIKQVEMMAEKNNFPLKATMEKE